MIKFSLEVNPKNEGSQIIDSNGKSNFIDLKYVNDILLRSLRTKLFNLS